MSFRDRIPESVKWTFTVLGFVLVILLVGHTTGGLQSTLGAEKDPEPPLCKLVLVTPKELVSDFRNASRLLNESQIIVVSNNFLDEVEMQKVVTAHLHQFLNACVRNTEDDLIVIQPKDIDDNRLGPSVQRLLDSNLIIVSGTIMNDQIKKIVAEFIAKFLQKEEHTT